MEAVEPAIGMLAAILAQHTIEDVVVEDPPLEHVIAEVFSQVNVSEDDGQPDDSTDRQRPAIAAPRSN